MNEWRFWWPFVFWPAFFAGLFWCGAITSRRRRAHAVQAIEQFEIDHQARIVSLRKARFHEFLFVIINSNKKTSYRVVIQYDHGRKRDAWLFYSHYSLRVVWLDSPDPEEI